MWATVYFRMNKQAVIDEAWDAIQVVLREVNLTVKIVRQKYDLCSKCMKFIKEANESGDVNSEELKVELETLGKTLKPLVNGYMAKIRSENKQEKEPEESAKVKIPILKLFAAFQFPVDLESPSWEDM